MPNALLYPMQPLSHQCSPFQARSWRLCKAEQGLSLPRGLGARGCCAKCLQPVLRRDSAAPSPLANCSLCSTLLDSTSKNSQVNNVLFLLFVRIGGCRITHTHTESRFFEQTYFQRILQLHCEVFINISSAMPQLAD